MEGMDANSGAITTVPMVTATKRKRGRPSKIQDGTNGVLPKARRIRKRRSEGTTPTVMDDSIIGQPIHGILDGCFDAGYILTVRVGSTDTVLRGVVFGPGLSLPITKETDIAPNVKFAKREENPVMSTAYQPSVASAAVHTAPRPSSDQPVAAPLEQPTRTPFPTLPVADSTGQHHLTPSHEYTPMQP